MDDGGGTESTAKHCTLFSESVTGAAGGGDVLTEFRRDGISPEYHFCSSDGAKSETRFWYLTTASGVFLVCTFEERAQLENKLNRFGKATEEIVSTLDPQFVFPFKVGATWGDRWEITAKLPKTVPAGAFNDCYEMTYETRKGDQKRWVCAGVGVVAYEYPSDTVGSHYRIELINFTISDGPKIH